MFLHQISNYDRWRPRNSSVAVHEDAAVIMNDVTNEFIACAKVFGKVLPGDVECWHNFVNKIIRKTWVQSSNNLKYVGNACLFEHEKVGSDSNVSQVESIDDLIHLLKFLLLSYGVLGFWGSISSLSQAGSCKGHAEI